MDVSPGVFDSRLERMPEVPLLGRDEAPVAPRTVLRLGEGHELLTAERPENPEKIFLRVKMPTARLVYAGIYVRV
jgi:hypothetical protein